MYPYVSETKGIFVKTEKNKKRQQPGLKPQPPPPHHHSALVLPIDKHRGEMTTRRQTANEACDDELRTRTTATAGAQGFKRGFHRREEREQREKREKEKERDLGVQLRREKIDLKIKDKTREILVYIPNKSGICQKKIQTVDILATNT